jgi:predicted nuclease with TOPRIM domain
MREVVYEDRNKYLRRVLLRDEDSDDMAAYGVPIGPPDIELVDWEAIKREINNYLVKNNVRTRTDLQRIRALDTICNVIKRDVDRVFREKATEEKRTRKA